MRAKYGTVVAVAFVVAVVCALVVLLTSGAVGQDQPKPKAPQMPQPPGGPGMGGPGGPPFMMGPGGPPVGFRPMPMPGMAPVPAIAVADGKVFIVLGGTLYKFDAETLELEGQNEFVERPPMGPPGMAGGGMPGMPPQPPAPE